MRKILGHLLLKLAGWTSNGELPERRKFVLIAAPHTSNWDFYYMLLFSWVYKLRIHWMGKHTLFKPPFGWIMKLLGGIPVDRRSKQNLVEQLAERFQTDGDYVIAIPAEGTRGYVEYWKSGFYHIAREAGVPICLGFLDYKRKEGGFGPLVKPTGDISADMDKIREFYSDKTGKYPELFGRILLRSEDTTEESATKPS